MSQLGSGYAEQIRYAIQLAVNKNYATVEETVQLYNGFANNLTAPLRVMIAGEFKTGKSTFINAILGREVLKSDVVPTTAVVTYLCYAAEEYLYVILKDGQGYYYPVEDLCELTSENTQKYLHIRDQIEAVYAYLNIDILQSICIIDSPGVNVRIDRHEDSTHSIIEDVDCVIWVMSVLHAGQKSEIGEINKLPQRLKPFIVLNKLDLLDPDEMDVDDAVKRMGQNISSYCTGFIAVSSYQALCALQNSDDRLWQESRFEQFMNILSRNYIDKKEELLIGRIQGEIAERRKIVSQVSEEKNREIIRKTKSWLFDHQKESKKSALQELSQQYKLEENRQFVGNIRSKKELKDVIEQVVAGLNSLQYELSRCMEIRKKSYYEKTLYKRVGQQIYECCLFIDAYEAYAEAQMDWRYINSNLQVLYTNYREFAACIRKEIDAIMKDDLAEIKQWQEKNREYQKALGYEIERDILKNLYF